MIKITSKLTKSIESQLDCKVLSHKPLGKGEHNVNFLLNTIKGDFVLRIYANTQFDNSEKEYKILKKLNGKCAPKVYFFDNSKSNFKYDYMIQEFIDGITLKKFSDNDLKNVAKIMKEIHQIKDLTKNREWKEPIGSWSKKNILQNSKYLGDEQSVSVFVDDKYINKLLVVTTELSYGSRSEEYGHWASDTDNYLYRVPPNYCGNKVIITNIKIRP